MKYTFRFKSVDSDTELNVESDKICECCSKLIMSLFELIMVDDEFWIEEILGGLHDILRQIIQTPGEPTYCFKRREFASPEDNWDLTLTIDNVDYPKGHGTPEYDQMTPMLFNKETPNG